MEAKAAEAIASTVESLGKDVGTWVSKALTFEHVMGTSPMLKEGDSYPALVVHYGVDIVNGIKGIYQNYLLFTEHGWRAFKELVQEIENTNSAANQAKSNPADTARIAALEAQIAALAEKVSQTVAPVTPTGVTVPTEDLTSGDDASPGTVNDANASTAVPFDQLADVTGTPPDAPVTTTGSPIAS